MNLKVRQVKKDDFDKLYAFWEEAGLKLYPYEIEKHKFISMLSLNPKLSLILTDKKDYIFGSILGAFDGRIGSIHRLAIKTELQKNGYGSFLLKKLEDKFRKLKIKKISVQIHVSNTEVLDFYKKSDYKDLDYAVNLYKDL